MKSVIQITLAAGLIAGSAASHAHQHLHHAKKHQVDQVVGKRDPARVTVYAAAATETVYEMGGKVIDADEAKDGLDEGNYVVIGESKPTYTPPPPPKTTSTSAELGALFIESKKTTSTTSTTTTTEAAPTTTTEPTTTSSPPPPETTTTAAAATTSSSGSGSGGTGLDAKFPSGEIKCSQFPSDYGAVPITWLETGGWSSLQFVPGYSSLSSSISEIIGGVAGQDCTKGTMCSYACPPGYQKTQWPKAQGSTKQSVGGLYCNSDGYLELTRDGYDTLCEPGVGGVTAQNDLDEEVLLCRTDYPASESMVIPAAAEPGGSVEVCNPDQTTYYEWDGMPTSAQYYINKKGYSKENACCWTSRIDAHGAGNWSPMILGVGRASDGITYISLFPNLPTSTAKLDFNVEITGDVSGECSYIDGVYSGGSSTGCTVSGHAPECDML